MSHPPYLRAKARELRTERRLTIDEIAERLALSRTTIYHWVRDLPPIVRRGRPATAGQLKGTLAIHTKHRLLREGAYAEGRESFDELALDPSFRTSSACTSRRATSAVATSCRSATPIATVVKLSDHWLRRLAVRAPDYGVQYHADQDLEELKRFWGDELGIGPDQIRMQRKSNSNQLARRSWRSVHGVLDRPRLRHAPPREVGWLDGPAPGVLALDCAFRGVAQPGRALGLGRGGHRFKSGRPDSNLYRLG